MFSCMHIFVIFICKIWLIFGIITTSKVGNNFLSSFKNSKQSDSYNSLWTQFFSLSGREQLSFVCVEVETWFGAALGTFLCFCWFSALPLSTFFVLCFPFVGPGSRLQLQKGVTSMGDWPPCFTVAYDTSSMSSHDWAWMFNAVKHIFVPLKWASTIIRRDLCLQQWSNIIAPCFSPFVLRDLILYCTALCSTLLYALYW